MYQNIKLIYLIRNIPTYASLINCYNARNVCMFSFGHELQGSRGGGERWTRKRAEEGNWLDKQMVAYMDR